MASIKKVKKSAGMRAGKPLKAGDPDPASYILLDSDDGSFTIQGKDAAGAVVDISEVATLTVSSDTPAVLTVDTPSGMSCACHGVTPGTAQVTAVATWTDGSVGPFTISFTATVGAGPATGLVITFGTPTIRG